MKQKTLHVDFNDSTLDTIAREGEHNRTQLVFVLDEDLQACDFINVEFGIESSGEKLVLENLCPKEGDNTLKVSLTQDVTVSGVLTIQLVGYVVDSATSEPQIIAKSPVVSGAVTPSINGIKKIAQGVAGLLDRILAKVTDLAKKAHEHKNKKTLEGFICEALETGFATDASSNELKWQGKPIAFDFAGSKVSMVQEVEKEGRRYYRLWFTHGSFSVTNVPDYIDIPIDTLNKVTESNGNITLNGAELDLGLGAKAGGIKSVTALPETANEGDVVLLYRCDEITADDSNSGIVLDIPAILSLGLSESFPEEFEQRVWRVTAANSKGTGLNITIEIKRIDDYILTGLVIVSETFAGRWYWKNGEFTTDIEGSETELPPVNIPLGLVEEFEYTAELIDFDGFPTPDGATIVTFRTLPLHYVFIDGEWQLASPNNEALQKAVEELQRNVGKYTPMTRIETTTTGTSILEPNKMYDYGVVDTLTVVFDEGEADKVNEYLFSFISGETATVLTLPSSVKWVNELTVEANKRYEISVVDNVALWCAVDYEVTG